jgi:hypothetical protein
MPRINYHLIGSPKSGLNLNLLLPPTSPMRYYVRGVRVGSCLSAHKTRTADLTLLLLKSTTPKADKECCLPASHPDYSSLRILLHALDLLSFDLLTVASLIVPHYLISEVSRSRFLPCLCLMFRENIKP